MILKQKNLSKSRKKIKYFTKKIILNNIEKNSLFRGFG